ncbi:hypothetical protein [Pendulispora albinea]|uniref:Cytochrome c domain-containing protein n=1 Tax=Pendulispora albinea TaxID=2741071 RepID=A0ABZ2LWM0_9BACT
MPPPDAGSGPLLPILGAILNEFGQRADLALPDTNLASTDDTIKVLGTNGRHCQTCHPNDAEWTATPAQLQARFEKGKPHAFGLCPLPTNESASTNDQLEAVFRTLDGANSPLADVSTPAARRSAYSMLLSRAVFRIGLAVPADADFELVAVDDPYGFASAKELSLFRRILPMANLRFNTTVMWDGREDVQCATLRTSLHQQARNAVTGHAQGPIPAERDVALITHSELGLYTTQFSDFEAGRLTEGGARGGPRFLAKVPFYWGINAFGKVDPQGQPYNREIFSLYEAWRNLPGESDRDKARVQIAEGEQVFNSKTFTVRGVSGFNDELGRPQIRATCGSCHNTPNVGTNSESRLMDIGVSDAARRTADLPLYTFRKKGSKAIKRTSDPGQALITKKWAHMNRFKVPSLRALAGRPPYMHDGSAPSLAAAVDYHDQRFGIHFSAKEKADLIAFLSAL